MHERFGQYLPWQTLSPCKIIEIASILSFHGRDLSTQLDFYSSPLLGTDFLSENCNNTLQPAI